MFRTALIFNLPHIHDTDKAVTFYSSRSQDMGMYLSETAGTFWLDRRKFLLRRKQLGEREQSPIFHVLRTFSYSGMFEAHVRGRIDDMSMTARDRANIMPHHQVRLGSAGQGLIRIPSHRSPRLPCYPPISRA